LGVTLNTHIMNNPTPLARLCRKALKIGYGISLLFVLLVLSLQILIFPFLKISIISIFQISFLFNLFWFSPINLWNIIQTCYFNPPSPCFNPSSPYFNQKLLILTKKLYLNQKLIILTENCNTQTWYLNNSDFIKIIF
jgi:hypothetical protein